MFQLAHLASTHISQTYQRPERSIDTKRMEQRKLQVDDYIPFFLQSAQSLLSGCLINSRKIFAFRSVVARSREQNRAERMIQSSMYGQVGKEWELTLS
jgi:hypothetical protein